MNDKVYNCKVSIIDFKGHELTDLTEKDTQIIETWFKHFTGWDNSDAYHNALKFITRIISLEEDLKENVSVKPINSLDDVSFILKNSEEEEMLISLVLHYDFDNPSKIIIIKRDSVVEFVFYPPKKKKISSKLTIKVNTEPENSRFYLDAFNLCLLNEEKHKNLEVHNNSEAEIDALKKARDILQEYSNENRLQKIIENKQTKSK